MGWIGGVLKEENKELYKLAKARVLGLGYGCGWEKFIVVAFAMAGLRLSKRESQRIVADFRESNPKITALWRKLDGLIRDSKGEHMDIVLPSGRELHYLNVRSKVQIKNKIYEGEGEMDIPEHERRFKTNYVADYGGRSGRPVYGALLTENMTQATAREVFADTLLALNDAGLRTPFHTHDEFVIDMPSDTKDEDVLEILRKCPPWIEGCPIEVEASRMERYAK